LFCLKYSFLIKWSILVFGVSHLYYDHFVTLVRYVERNARKASLVQNAEDWRWSSVWRREKGSFEQKKILSDWPVTAPDNYLNFLNQPQTAGEEEEIEESILRGGKAQRTL
jgi:putative transposase